MHGNTHARCTEKEQIGDRALPRRGPHPQHPRGTEQRTEGRKNLIGNHATPRKAKRMCNLSCGSVCVASDTRFCLQVLCFAVLCWYANAGSLLFALQCSVGSCFTVTMQHGAWTLMRLFRERGSGMELACSGRQALCFGVFLRFLLSVCMLPSCASLRLFVPHMTSR
jgi:hypothetical protein